MSDQLIDAVELGEEARGFLESNLCKKMLEMADDEAGAAMHRLATVNPQDVQEILKLQNQVRFGQSFASWLINFVKDADAALAAFQQSREAL